MEKCRDGLSGIGWWNEYVEVMERYGASRLPDGSYTNAFRNIAKQDYFQNNFSYHLEDYYPRVECPILMVAGKDVLENDREKSAMQGLNKLAPQAQAIKVTGWEHPYGWMINPDAMCQAILEFIKT